MFKKILQLLLGVKKRPAYALVPKQNNQRPQPQKNQQNNRNQNHGFKGLAGLSGLLNVMLTYHS